MPSRRPPPRLHVPYDRRLKAQLSQLRPLRYAAGADASDDLPAYVRAASAIRRIGARLVIIQDDVNALAIVDPYSGLARPLLLPPGPSGERMFDDLRGNKVLKLDLEACVRLPCGRLVAFGSGSSPLRERLVVLDTARDAAPRIVEAPTFYAMLRAHAAGHAAELNVEGGVVQGRWLRLLQRGHGRRPSALWNAVLDFPLAEFTGWLDGQREIPRLARTLDVDLGGASGVPFGFTDACVTVSGRLAFLACAEDSVDVRNDGPVLGCRFDWLAADARTGTMTDVLGPDGQPTRLKLEGIETAEDNETLFQVVADMDRPDEPALLGTLSVGSAR